MDENINQEKTEKTEIIDTHNAEKTEVTNVLGTSTKKTDTGVVKGNIVGVLAYLGGILAAILILLLEKNNKFVRFHAMQSAITFVAIFVIVSIMSMVASVVWVLFALIPLIWLLGIALFIFLMYKAYQGEVFKVPVLGDFVAKQVEI